LRASRSIGRGRRGGTAAVFGCIAVVAIASCGGGKQATGSSGRRFDPTRVAPIAVHATIVSVVAERLDVVAPVLSVVAGEPPRPHPSPRPVPNSTWLRIPPILFKLNEATPSKTLVSDIARTIRRHRGRIVGLRIDGNADDLGTPLYNLALSRRRACHVAQLLRQLLVSRVPAFNIGAFGEARPVAPNILPDGSDDPRGRARNRRVEIVVLRSRPRPGLRCTQARGRHHPRR
jgi:outer membrane protein OmpA-like peptidoglycan-associated protein